MTSPGIQVVTFRLNCLVFFLKGRKIYWMGRVNWGGVFVWTSVQLLTKGHKYKHTNTVGPNFHKQHQIRGYLHELGSRTFSPLPGLT